MIVGILSDTHDNLANTQAGVALLVQAKADYFIHCGDVGGEAIFDCLAGHPLSFVWGNNDWDRTLLADYAQSLGFQCLGDGGEIELAGKKLFVTHGDHGDIVRRVLTEQRHDYLLLGHSHRAADQQQGRVRIINPGALHRASRKTVAVLDLTNNLLQYLDVK